MQFDVRRGDVAGNLEQATAGIEAAARDGARLIVLPEMWTTSFVENIDDALLDASREAEQSVIQLAKRLDLVIVGGGLDRASGKFYNRALVVDSGHVLGSYRKIHLFTPNAEDRLHSPGSTPLIVDTSVGRLGVVICYDIRFPELIRYYFCQGVELLAIPSQWPEARAGHWRALLKARAIENEMFVLGCNRTGAEPSLKTDELLHFPGDSRIVDPMGDTLVAGKGENGALCAQANLRDVRTMRRILPVARDRRPEIYDEIWGGSWAPTPRDA